MSNLVVAAVADTTVDTRPIPSAEAWFAGGERVGYDPGARATIAAQDGAAAGFVADHKAQGDRLDFGRLFTAYRDQFPFLVGGSDEDPFEHRQVDLAEERLGRLDLQIERLSGGHLTTNEQPEALAALIAKFERGRIKMQEPRSTISTLRSEP